MRKGSKQQPNVRIISGHWRTRKLPFRVADGLKPTGDRVRETLFNWLQSDIHGAHCLDLFAGSGALGFEAASRGAASVTCVEIDRDNCRQLIANTQALNATQITVVNADAFHYLPTTAVGTTSFDIIFIDPPFALDLFDQACAQIEASLLIDSDALIYLETPYGQSFKPSPRWRLKKSARAGQVMSWLYQRN